MMKVELRTGMTSALARSPSRAGAEIVGILERLDEAFNCAPER